VTDLPALNLKCKHSLRRYLKSGSLDDACKALGIELTAESRAEAIYATAEAEVIKVAFMDDEEYIKFGPSGKDKMQALNWLLAKYAPDDEKGLTEEVQRVILEIPSNGRGPKAIPYDYDAKD